MAERDFAPYASFFHDVPFNGWQKALAEGPTWMDATTRKNLAWVAMCDLAKQYAGGVRPEDSDHPQRPTSAG